MKKFFQVVVVYKNPKDYPDKFVARNQFVDDNGKVYPEDACVVSSKYESIKIVMEAMKLTRMERIPEDDACILETWI